MSHLPHLPAGGFLGRYWLLLLLAIPFFTGLGDSSVWDASEAFYAETPREMVERGDWVVPYFNGHPRLNKPPLAYWVVALPYRLFGVDLIWERGVMAALAYFNVWLVFALGRGFLSRQAALLGAGIFATGLRYMIMSRRLLIDVLLLTCILAATVAFFRWLDSGQRMPFLLSAACFGLGFLAKGPVALLPLPILLLFLWRRGQLRQLRRAPWGAGLALALALGLGWFLWLALRLGPGPVLDFFWQENLARFGLADFGPRRGPLFYLGVFLADFLPWSLLFPAAVLTTLRHPEEKSQGAITFFILWTSLFFLLFSLARNKQEYYIVPLYPVAALWMGHWLDRGLAGWLSRLLLGATLSLLSVGVYLLARGFLEGSFLWLPLLSIPLAVTGVVWRSNRALVAAAGLFYTLAFLVYLGPFEAYKPVRPLARAIREHAGTASYRAGYYRFTAPSLTFYLEPPIEEIYQQEEAVRLLRSPERVYLLLKEQDRAALEQAAGVRLEIVAQKPKIYTTGRTLLEVLQSGRTDSLSTRWAEPIDLVTKRPGSGP